MFQNTTAVVFDMFGTCVDWRGGLIAACRDVGPTLGLELEWDFVADRWRALYAPAIDRIRSADLPWMNLDELNELILRDILRELSITASDSSITSLNRCWERLPPWPDVVPGLARIKQRRVIAPLSNGTVATLVGIARFGGLPWDCILSSEIARCYKWDPEAYQMACRLLRAEPPQVLMVAAHRGDLRAASRAGLRTCFVARPGEYGPHPNKDLEGTDVFDLHVRSFEELALRLQ